jgi:hypothetical protein
MILMKFDSCAREHKEKLKYKYIARRCLTISYVLVKNPEENNSPLE